VFIPIEFLTEEICEAAVRKNGDEQEEVPPQFRTDEIINIAKRQLQEESEAEVGPGR
jgi:hypothetical protein